MSNAIKSSLVPSSSGGGINYSTSEQDTGLTWIDGKKIYQKTISIILPTCTTDGTSANALFSTGTTIIKCISCESWFITNTGICIFPNDAFYLSSSNTIDYIRINVRTNTASSSSEKNMISVQNANTAWNGASGYVTIQYTKT